MDPSLRILMALLLGGGVTGCSTQPRLPSAAFTLLTAPDPAGGVRCRLYDDLAFASDPTGAIPLWEGESVQAAVDAAVRMGKKQRRQDVTWRDLPAAGYRLPNAASIARVEADFAAGGLQLSVVPSGH
jgi:hypothetical protein